MKVMLELKISPIVSRYKGLQMGRAQGGTMLYPDLDPAETSLLDPDPVSPLSLVPFKVLLRFQF